MTSNQNRQDTTDIPSNAGPVAVIANAVLKTVGKQLPSSQEERGDYKLERARDLVSSEVQNMAEEGDLRVIEEKIT